MGLFFSSFVPQSKGFVDEFFSDFSQITSILHPPSDYIAITQLLSFQFKFRFLFAFPVLLEKGFPSLQFFFPASTWPEREIFEMFGVPIYASEPVELDLRRLLTDYGFTGFPLRKSYPTVGFSEIRYDPILSRIVEDPLVLDQTPPPVRKEFIPWTLAWQTRFIFTFLKFADFEFFAIA